MEIVTGMVARAMVSSISVACIHAQLHLKSSKSSLVITVQSTMGEPSARQELAKILSVLSRFLWPIARGFSVPSSNRKVRASLSCWLRARTPIPPLIQSLGKHSILGLLEDNCHHMIQHCLPISRRTCTPSCHHGSADKLLLKEFRGLGFFYTQEAKSPYPVHRSVVLAHCCFLSFKLQRQTKGGVAS